jgi:hypothetical protein
MENAKKFLPLIIGGIVAIFVFFLSLKLKNSKKNNEDRGEILERAREAKLAKSILKKSQNEESTTDIES